MSYGDAMSRNVRLSDGVRFAVQEHGNPAGPTIVAVHGYPDDHRVWDGVTADLAADHHVVTYDVRGAGASEAPITRAGYRLDRLADDLAAVLDAVSPDRPVHLLGHDWGRSRPGGPSPIPGWVIGSRPFTSISGPCLDHIAAWYARRGPGVRAETLRQAAKSWYTLLFRLPVLPELGWRSGLFGRVAARSRGCRRRSYGTR